MPGVLRYRLLEIKNGIKVEVEVPGYSKEEVSVEIRPYTYDLFGSIPVTTKALCIEAKNDARGLADSKLVIENIEKVKVEEITATVKEGLLTITLPFSNKFRDRVIPVT